MKDLESQINDIIDFIYRPHPYIMNKVLCTSAYNDVRFIYSCMLSHPNTFKPQLTAGDFSKQAKQEHFN